MTAMKAIMIALLSISLTAGLTSCVVRERSPGPGYVWVRGHYDVGPYGGRHWVRPHWARI